MDNRVSENTNTEGHEAGRPNSPKLFTATIHEVFKNAQLEEKRMNVGGAKLSDLKFADDIALTTEGV